MPVKFGSILHLNNSASEATMDASNLRGTTILIDNLNSESLATIGAGLPTAPGKRRLGTIVSTTGSEHIGVKYYTYIQTSSGDTNISGSEWTTLTNWSEISTGGITEDTDWFIDISNNRITASLDVYVKNNFTASNISAGDINATNVTSSNILANGNIKSYGNVTSINGNFIADNGEVRANRIIAGNGGNASQPAFSFAGDENNSGIYIPSADNLAIQVNAGSTEMSLSPSQINLTTDRIKLHGNVTASDFTGEVNISASGYVAANYIKLKSRDATPTAVAGGFYYSSSNEFYLGFSS